QFSEGHARKSDIAASVLSQVSKSRSPPQRQRPVAGDLGTGHPRFMASQKWAAHLEHFRNTRRLLEGRARRLFLEGKGTSQCAFGLQQLRKCFSRFRRATLYPSTPYR